MRVDTSGIDPAELMRSVADAYGLAISTLDFLPKGEEVRNANYVAAGLDGRRYLVKAQPAGELRHLATVYDILHAIRTRASLGQVVAPLPDRRAAFVSQIDRHAVAVFSFIEGHPLWESERPFVGAVVTAAAALMASLHRSGTALDASLLQRVPREMFAHPFAAPIRRALAASETVAADAGGYQRQLARLLRAEERDILATLERMEHWRRDLGRLTTNRVITHGDPNLANLIVDAQGALHLIDWGELAIGPPERDLIFFTGPSFEDFIRHYRAAYGEVRLHRDLFAYYHYRWAVQEIADYATRILFQHTTPLADEHAWAELQPYLPIPHREIETQVAATEAAAARASIAWV